MDGFELKPAPKTKEQGTRIWNLLTAIVMLIACLLAYVFLTIFINPNSSLNPFKPAPTAVRYQTSTPTNTIIPLPPTWTPTPTRQPSATRTKAPSRTPIPPTETVVPTETETLAATPTGDTPTMTISLTPMPVTAEITYQSSTTTHANSACNWMGVGGKVLDSSGEPLKFQTVKLGGSLNGAPIDRQMLSGDVPAYGESGFEFLLGNTPVASSQELWIQLFDNTGMPLTQPVYFDTYTDCNKNLVMIVFTKTQ
jgi:hypothetical protein